MDCSDKSEVIGGGGLGCVMCSGSASSMSRARATAKMPRSLGLRVHRDSIPCVQASSR